MRVGILALAGATTLSLAACSSSNQAKPAQPAAPTSSSAAPTAAPSRAPAPGGEQRVAGLIVSVAGDTIQVTQPNGTAAVDFTSSTEVSEVTSAGLPDVTPGSCVAVRPTRGDNPQGGAVTAGTVRVIPAVDGKCPEPKQPPAGSTPPPQPPNPGIQGTVASVAGNTITVNNAGAGGTPETTVTVSDKTRYTKEAPANSQAIAQGKCITAQGTESSGALQATTIRLRPARNGKCPEPGARPHGHGG